MKVQKSVTRLEFIRLAKRRCYFLFGRKDRTLTAPVVLVVVGLPANLPRTVELILSKVQTLPPALSPAAQKGLDLRGCLLFDNHICRTRRVVFFRILPSFTFGVFLNISCECSRKMRKLLSLVRLATRIEIVGNNTMAGPSRAPAQVRSEKVPWDVVSLMSHRVGIAGIAGLNLFDGSVKTLEIDGHGQHVFFYIDRPFPLMRTLRTQPQY